MLNKNKKSDSGFIFLEIIIAIALISTVFITLLGVGLISLNVSTAIKKESQADSLTKEELEAARSFRDTTTWANFKNVNFSSPNTYYFALSGNQWIRNSGTETVGIFTRNVIFDHVYRDANGHIAGSGSLDENTIKVTATISWDDKTSEVATYLTNWQYK